MTRDQRNFCIVWVTMTLVLLLMAMFMNTSSPHYSILMQKTYSGESLIDCDQDLIDALDPRLSHLAARIPLDPGNIPTGTFRLTLEWIPD